MALQHIRSSTLDKRPQPASLSDGQLAINTNLNAPGVFFKDSNGALVKVGPTFVGTTAPNSTPGSGGATGNTLGEQWLDTSGGTYVLKIWDGTAWRSEAGEFVNVTGDTMTGALVMDNQQQVRFRETTANGTNYIALQAPASVASDKTITLPDVTGTVVTTGDTGSVTSTMIADGTIVNGDVNASAAIAGTKISPDFGSQNVTTTGTVTGASLNPTSSTVPTNGVYLPAANSVGISTGGSGRLFVDSSGNVGVGLTPSTWSVGKALQVGNASNALFGATSGQLNLMQNANFDGDFKYVITAAASYYQQLSGSHIWYTAPSGTAGTTATFSERVRITNSGNVGIGTTSPTTNLHVVGAATTNPSILLAETSGSSLQIISGASDSFIGTNGSTALRLGTAFTERARIDSSGRLLVGTSSSPSAGYGQYARVVIQGYIGNNNEDGALALQRGEAAATITAGENIGRISFNDNAGNSFADINVQADGAAGTNDYPGRLVFSTTADGASSPTERMRIRSSGLVYFSSNMIEAPNWAILGEGSYTTIDSRNNVPLRMGAGGAGGGPSTQGVQLSVNATSWSTWSDERYKADLVPIADGLQKVGSLRAVTGRYKEDDESVRRSFLIAQDLQAVLPEAVDETDPDRLGLRYTEVIPLLVAALKESKERIETLEAKVAALESA